MTKQEFLSRLEKRLEILNKKERDDILLEYSQHIDFKVQSGLTEEEAIKDFGDIDQLADEILNAYNVNTDYMKNQKPSLEKTVASWLKKIADTIDAVSDNIIKKDKKEIFMIIIKFLIVIAFLAVLRIPVEMVIGLIHMMFGFLPSMIYTFITTILEICINIIYLAIICYTIYFFSNALLHKRAGRIIRAAPIFLMSIHNNIPIPTTPTLIFQHPPAPPILLPTVRMRI